MQEHNIEAALCFRDVGEDGFEIGVATKQEEIIGSAAGRVGARVNTQPAAAVIDALKIFEEVGVGGDAFFGVEERVGVPVEVLTDVFPKLLEIEIFDVS